MEEKCRNLIGKEGIPGSDAWWSATKTQTITIKGKTGSSLRSRGGTKTGRKVYQQGWR